MRMAITAVVAAVLVPPGSLIVAGALRVLAAAVRVATYPTRLALRLLWWLCPLRWLLHALGSGRGRAAPPTAAEDWGEETHDEQVRRRSDRPR